MNALTSYIDILKQDKTHFNNKLIKSQVEELLALPPLDEEIYYIDMFSFMDKQYNKLDNKVLMNNLVSTINYLDNALEEINQSLFFIDSELVDLQNNINSIYLNSDSIEVDLIEYTKKSIDKLISDKDLYINKLSTFLRLKNNLISLSNFFTLRSITNQYSNELENLDAQSIEIDEKIKKQQFDFIGLLALFSSLAFIVFGGLGYLNSIGQIIEKISNERLIFIGTLFSFVTFNLIALFLYMVEKIIDPNPSKLKNIILIVNFILIITLLCYSN